MGQIRRNLKVISSCDLVLGNTPTVAERDTELIDGHNKLALRRGRVNRLEIVEIEDGKFGGFLEVLEGKVGICGATLNSKLRKMSNTSNTLETMKLQSDSGLPFSMDHLLVRYSYNRTSTTKTTPREEGENKRTNKQNSYPAMPQRNPGESCSAASLKYFADSSSLPASWNLIAFATFASASLDGANSSFSLRDGFFCAGVECELPDGFGDGASGPLFVAGDCGFEVGGE
ncbi:hypothetical protein BC937DRAFT_94064 [Endogone sp. FLAS-F59071]|nr:hypothetical protein BC937DRAFT_94064 [Endogone sp. FLAS-F59071]|eukprot:RUS14277.1 hypothetical protein BC937DRAFT_94064 [Endogone sp. FLAS-F59071]